MEKEKLAERKYWEEHMNEEAELKRPYQDAWKTSRWKKEINLITSHYDFAQKRIFVGCCGTGIFEKEIPEIAPVKEIVGLDLTPGFIKLARIRNADNPYVRFVIGDVEETGFPDGYFDVAVISSGLHHVPHPYVALKEMKRISRDLVLHEPNALNPIRRFNELRDAGKDVRESSFYEWQLRSWLKKLHYQEVSLHNIEFIPHFTPGKLLKLFERMENVLERLPLVRKISGAFLVIARG